MISNSQYNKRGAPLAETALISVGIALLSVHNIAAASSVAPLAEWQYSAGVLFDQISPQPQPDWSVMLGSVVDSHPNYQGSSHTRVYVYPMIDIRYKSIAFASTEEGVGVNLLNMSNARAGVAITYDPGRAQAPGLDPLHHAPEAKAFFEYLSGAVVGRLDIHKAFGGSNGISGDLGIYGAIPFNRDLTLLTGPSLEFQNQRSSQADFGVTSDQARKSGYSAYLLGTGATSVSWGTNAEWDFGKHGFLEGYFGVEQLIGEASHSSIVEQRVQWEWGLSAGYSF